MEIIVSQNDHILGQKAASKVSHYINEAIKLNGIARLILATGASQFTTLDALLKEKIDWSKVEIFHLDEYIGLEKDHPASFIKYLNDRFVSKVNPKAVHYVDPSVGVNEIIEQLTHTLKDVQIDCALMGIGENGHIAFNDPPADFDTEETYIKVKLDEGCRNQQLREGWFKDLDAIPTHALTMSVHQIMKTKHIVLAVPYEVKRKAVKNTLEQEINPNVPATILKKHPSVYLYLDTESASGINL